MFVAALPHHCEAFMLILDAVISVKVLVTLKSQDNIYVIVNVVAMG